MRRAVPPMARVVIPVILCIIRGSTAIDPRNSAPKRVMRFNTRAIYSEVELPGRTPGMKAPFFCRFSAIEFGSNVTAV